MKAESNYRQSLDWTRRLGALSWDLRTTHLWRRKGKVGDATELLSSVHGRFTEGFETADIGRASALLDEIRRR